MRIACIVLLPLWTLMIWAQAPLTRPMPPKVEIKGQAGMRTVYYWAYATDARGHSAYSDPVVVTNAPNHLSAENAVVLTPVPVDGATRYGILSSRCDAPNTAEVKVGAPGKRTYYYWFQARNGRSVWSPVEGPLEVKGCAQQPENTISWADTGIEFYYLYRTDTPVKPLGWRACALLAGGKELSWSDKGLTPTAHYIDPTGNAFEKPEGQGPYLVGTSKGDAIIDQGQKLGDLIIYDLNTTDPAFNPFKPMVKAYEPGNAGYATMQLETNHRAKTPKYNWENLNSFAIVQNNIAGGRNDYPADFTIDKENGKNTYNGVSVLQFNYTPAQHSPYLTFMYNYGMGDNVLFHAALEQQGQNRTRGDEGSEFFSLHMNRRLMMNRAKLGANAIAGATFLQVGREIGTVAGARGIVNLTQKYSTGTARVEGRAMAMGTGTNWTPEMEGRWISFDADAMQSNNQTLRQWYMIERYISPTQLQLFAYTYWGRYNYKGRAGKDGGYQICPYTEMTDGDAMTGQGLKVTPLTCAWNAGDELEAIAGPQTTSRLGWWEMGGEYLPQDHVAGLGIAYNGNKPSDEGALITYKWSTGLEVHDGNVGISLINTRAGMQAYKETPVLISVIRDDPHRFQLGQNADGFVIENHANQPWVSLGAKGVTLHGNATITGSARTRGQVTFSGDGQRTEFAVAFPVPFAQVPFVVASSNHRIGMSVEKVTPAGFTVGFATAVPVGADNLVITWMAQE